jgi:hypothetical protein
LQTRQKFSGLAQLSQPANAVTPVRLGEIYMSNSELRRHNSTYSPVAMRCALETKK